MIKNRKDGEILLKYKDQFTNKRNDNVLISPKKPLYEVTKTDSRDSEQLVSVYDKKETGLQERSILFDDESSKGSFNEIYIEGAHIFYGDFFIHRTRVIEAEVLSPIVQMYFLLSGNNVVTYPGNKVMSQIKYNENNIFLRSYSKGKYHLEGNKLQNFGIQLSEKFFSRLINGNCAQLDKIAEGVEKGKEYVQLSERHLLITPQMKAVIHDIKNNPRTGFMKRLYVESKIIELFMLQVELAGNSNYNKKTNFKKEDIDRLFEAKIFIENNILSEFTLLELCRKIGLNDFKLKKGFKELFGKTVFSYLNELKMDYAKQLLLDREKTIAEISVILGYSQPHHFSAAFKKRFGYSPVILKRA
ncbi:MAG: AraC family transcriptional regulator [Ignavibacteriaceae bacterium]